jgi:hypothetical protein
VLAERLGVEPDGVDRHAAFVAQAALVARAAFEQSDGTRAGIAGGLLGVEIADGLIGSFRFDPNGDPVAQGEWCRRVHALRGSRVRPAGLPAGGARRRGMWRLDPTGERCFPTQVAGSRGALRLP